MSILVACARRVTSALWRFSTRFTLAFSILGLCIAPTTTSAQALGGLFPNLVNAAKQAAMQRAFAEVGRRLGDNLPLRLDAQSVLPTVEAPTGFRPIAIDCTPSNLHLQLPPGDYTCKVRGYCTMDSIHRPGGGVPYELARLQGKQADALAQLINRAAAANIDPHTIQVISWSIQSSIPLTQMPPANQRIVHQLIPEYENGLNGDFLQNAESTYGTIARVAHLPPLDQELSQMGPLGRTIMEIRRSREIIRQDALNYDRLNEHVYDGPPGQEVIRPAIPIPSPWSQIRPNVIAQFVIQQGNLGQNTLNFRVLPSGRAAARETSLFQRASYEPETAATGSFSIAQGPATPFELVLLSDVIDMQLIGYSKQIAAQALMLAMMSDKPGSSPVPPLVAGSQTVAGAPVPDGPEEPDDTPQSRKVALKRAGLPTSGRIRYVPPKSWNASEPLPRSSGGYVDKFGNIWTKGPSRTEGDDFEWDVQLSRTGKAQIGEFSRSGDHVNITPSGEISH